MTLHPTPASAPPTPLRSAAPVGAWVLPFITAGFSFGVVPLIALALLGIIAAAAGPGFFFGATLGLFGSLGRDPWWLAVPIVVGTAMLAIGIVGGVRLLRRRGQPAPVKVTWLGALIGLPLQLVMNGAFSLFSALVVSSITGERTSLMVLRGESPLALGIFLALAVPATAALGALIWHLLGEKPDPVLRRL